MAEFYFLTWKEKEMSEMDAVVRKASLIITPSELDGYRKAQRAAVHPDAKDSKFTQMVLERGQKELADDLGVYPSTVYSWIVGRKFPKLTQWVNILSCSTLTIRDLIDHFKATNRLKEEELPVMIKLIDKLAMSYEEYTIPELMLACGEKKEDTKASSKRYKTYSVDLMRLRQAGLVVNRPGLAGNRAWLWRSAAVAPSRVVKEKAPRQHQLAWQGVFMSWAKDRGKSGMKSAFNRLDEALDRPHEMPDNYDPDFSNTPIMPGSSAKANPKGPPKRRRPGRPKGSRNKNYVNAQC